MKVHVTHVVIPIAIYANKNISNTAKLLFPVIAMLDDPETGCYAKNDYLI